MERAREALGFEALGVLQGASVNKVIGAGVPPASRSVGRMRFVNKKLMKALEDRAGLVVVMIGSKELGEERWRPGGYEYPICWGESLGFVYLRYHGERVFWLFELSVFLT